MRAPSTTSSFDDQLERLTARGLNGAGIRIGHLDTGVDTSHPAFKARIERCRSFSLDGFSFVDEGGVDTATHGTHTAGLIVGLDRKRDFTGAAPGARLLSGTVIEGGEVVARIMLGLDWLLGHGVRLVCLSIGVPPPSPVVEIVLRLLRERGVLIIAPIGNGGAGRFVLPGGSSEVLGVGAGDDANVSSFSGSRNDCDGRCFAPHVVAPGVARRGPVPGAGYATRSGTSSACALVAGLAARMIQARPDATPGAIVSAITATATPPPDHQAHRCTSGFVEPTAAVDALARRSNVTDDRWGEVELSGCTVDPRLTEVLARTHRVCNAVTVFTDTATRDRVVATVDDIAEVKLLQHLPVAIIRAPPRTHKAYLGTEGVRASGTTDFDRASRFFGRH